jgi:hypothetical protein
LGSRYRLQVRAWKLEGPDLNNYGLVFGGQDDHSYYTFRISDTGSYRIAKQVDGQWQDLVPWTTTPTIQQGGTNALALIVDGTQVYACINDTLVGSVNDPALGPGRVGMVAGAYDEPTHIHFDDFGVWNIEGPVTVAAGGIEPRPPAPVAAAGTEPQAPTPVTPSAAPGVYVKGLRTTDAVPIRNVAVTFVATFLNTTGAPQEYDWLVIIQEPEAKKAFGETDVQRITVPVGVSEITSASNWTVRGPGGCLPLYARPYFQNPDSSRTPFKQVDGSDLTFGFVVCP